MGLLILLCSGAVLGWLVALVTGADSGIGRAVAVLFAREGANVAIAYLEEHDDARITREACEAEGAEVLLSAGDVVHLAVGGVDGETGTWVLNVAGPE